MRLGNSHSAGRKVLFKSLWKKRKRMRVLMRMFFSLLVICPNISEAELLVSNRSIPYFRQSDFVGFGESACGPTSLSMILKYYFPYSQINPGQVYHSGTQAYKYNGPVIYYKNLTCYLR